MSELTPDMLTYTCPELVPKPPFSQVPPPLPCYRCCYMDLLVGACKNTVLVLYNGSPKYFKIFQEGEKKTAEKRHYTRIEGCNLFFIFIKIKN